MKISRWQKLGRRALAIAIGAAISPLAAAYTTAGANYLAIPSNQYECPPAYYMLFICKETNGLLPSEGKFIRILPSIQEEPAP
ncbi:MAG: hypothetical protein U1D55_03480 [Phycisphaerae bacterium]